MKLNAVLYMRYSIDMQTENSIDGQRRVNIDFAKNMGLTVIGEYIDRAISGKTDKRPEFQRMMEDIENSNIDVNFVIVYKLDRFARNEDMHREYERRLNKTGVFILSATEAVNENNLASKVVKSVCLALNEEEVRKISENVTRGKIEAAYKGKWCGGPPPFGYDYDHKTKKLVINEAEASAVRLAFDLRKTGFSYSYIANELNKSGYRRRTGKEFDSSCLSDLFRNKNTKAYTCIIRQRLTLRVVMNIKTNLKSSIYLINVRELFPMKFGIVLMKWDVMTAKPNPKATIS